jgi:DNA damage-inducible protein 1
MLLTITNANQTIIFQVEISSDENVEYLKVLITFETGIDADKQLLRFGGRELNSNLLISQTGLSDGDLVFLEQVQNQPAPRNTVPSGGTGSGVSLLASNLISQMNNRNQTGTRSPGITNSPVQNNTAPIPTPIPTPTPTTPTNTNPDNKRAQLSETMNRFMTNRGNENQIQYTDPEVFRSYCHSNPDFMMQIEHSDQELYNAVTNGSTQVLDQLLRQRAVRKHEMEMERRREIMQLNDNPYDENSQRIIEERIQQENINENYQTAVEYLPESFARVFMLYIPIEVDGHPITAFVDSGAQNTIMSEECARRCNVIRLLDKRFAGVAAGIGTAKILGRVHLAPLKIGNSFFNCSFTILEGTGIEFLLGLDMLKRYQAIIDLRENCLRIENEVINFLDEKDIPENELNQRVSDELLEKYDLPRGGDDDTQPEKVETSPMEEKISIIISFGHSRERAIEALTVCNGDIDDAVAYLYSD